MAKKSAGPSIDELVTQALVRIATADAPQRLTGKGDPAPLFASAAGANKAALERLQNEAEPLVVTTGSGKAAPVRLTAAGFALALPHLPPESVGGAAKALAATFHLAERVEFLQEIVSRSPDSTAELYSVQEIAGAELQAETEARVAKAVKRREADDRWKSLIELQRKQRIDALTRELEAEGGKVPPPAANNAPPERTREPHSEPLVPKTAADVGYHRQVVRRLVSSWAQQWDHGKHEGRQAMETALGGMTGMRRIGSAGETVAFDGAVHESGRAVSEGERVKVVRPGWQLIEEEGPLTLLKTRVE